MKRLVVVLAAIGILGGVASAGPITYTESATVSGTFGGTPFTNTLVTVTLTGDSANVTPGPVPFTDVVENSGTATVNVFGLGTATFTDSIVIISTLTDNVLGGPA